jgi:hypothetical protein
LKTRPERYIYTLMVITALFTIAKMWKRSKSLSIDEQTSKM